MKFVESAHDVGDRILFGSSADSTSRRDVCGACRGPGPRHQGSGQEVVAGPHVGGLAFLGPPETAFWLDAAEEPLDNVVVVFFEQQILHPFVRNECG